MVTHAAKSCNQTQLILRLGASQHLQADNEIVEGLLALRRQSVSDDGLATFLLDFIILLLKTFDVADDLTELRGVHCAFGVARQLPLGNDSGLDGNSSSGVQVVAGDHTHGNAGELPVAQTVLDVLSEWGLEGHQGQEGLVPGEHVHSIFVSEVLRLRFQRLELVQ